MSDMIELQSQTFTYNRRAAVAYALRHWDDPNPRFANMDTMGGGGDCTNFTSQALLAGGWPMDYRRTGFDTEWWYRRIGTDPWDREADDWWSCTWALPDSQFRYLEHNYAQSYDLLRSPQEVRRLALGDIIYYDWHGEGRFGHSAIITDFDRFGRPLVTYRTLAPLSPVRNRHWQLRFRRDAARIVALHLPDRATSPGGSPNWNALRPCDSTRAARE